MNCFRIRKGFLSGSIPSSAFREFRSFSEFFNHTNLIVCRNCVQILQEMPNWVEDEISAVGRMSRAIANASTFEENFHAV